MISKTLKIILALLFLIFLAVFFWIGGTIMKNASSDLPYKGDAPDYVLLLGCRIDGDRPGKLMEARIETAVSFLNAHPEAIAVCCGGQGADEIIDEATVMANALKEKGLDEDRILLEKTSTSTLENFTFAKALLDEASKGEPYRIAFVTNDYHLYRSRRVAAQAGFENAIGLGAQTPTLSLYLSLPREIAAVAYYQFPFRK